MSLRKAFVLASSLLLLALPASSRLGAPSRTERLADAITEIDLGPAADRWGGGAPILVSTQLPHIGVMTKLPWYLRTASRMIALERWRADDVLRAVAEHRITTIGGVAPQVALLLRSPLLDELDLSCVQAFVMGGAMSSPGLVEEARRRFGAAYSIRYSSTESGGVGLGTAFDACYNPIKDAKGQIIGVTYIGHKK